MAHILLLEPTQILADVCQKALSMAGHTVVWRQTAEQGVTALDEHKIDIIVLEIQIPIHNGIEFLYEMRSYNDWLDIPVLLYTDVRKAPEFDDALSRLKVAEWLYKPQTSLHSLVHAVDATLKAV